MTTSNKNCLTMWSDEENEKSEVHSEGRLQSHNTSVPLIFSTDNLVTFKQSYQLESIQAGPYVSSRF